MPKFRSIGVPMYASIAELWQALLFAFFARSVGLDIFALKKAARAAFL
jgi:hypothetical protein